MAGRQREREIKMAARRSNGDRFNEFSTLELSEIRMGLAKRHSIRLAGAHHFRSGPGIELNDQHLSAIADLLIEVEIALDKRS